MSAMLWETPLAELTSRVEALEAAASAKTKRTKGISEPLGVSPDKFCRLLVASGKVLGDAIDPGTFGVIGRKFNKSGIVAEDVPKFEAWLASGGLNWVKTPFVWNSICRGPQFLLLDWIARARAYTSADPPAPASCVPETRQTSFDFKSLMRPTKG